MRISTLKSLLLFFGVIFVDQFSKKWAINLPSLRFNEGIIMGLYSDLPESLRIISLASFSGFIFFLYISLLFIVPNRAQSLKYGLSLIVGGVFGNVIDKIISGRTTDFIPFTITRFSTFFNLADVSLWIGAGVIVWFIFKREKLIWYPENTRQNYLVRPKDQVRVALFFSSVAFCSCLVLGIFSYTFFNTLLKSLSIGNQNIMVSYFFTYCTLTMLFCLMAFVTGIILSHRTSGPLYAFELFVNDLVGGKSRKLKLRDGDSYQDLEKMAEKLRTHFTIDKE